MLRVRIVAADSMGVRSLAVVVETAEAIVGIDLGASIAPRRYGLPPHEIELRRLEESLGAVERAIGESDIIIITHYHYDHFIRDNPELYKNKILLIKHPKQNINRSQAIRSYVFLKKNRVEELAKRIETADGRSFSFGRLRIDFSPPVWHGYPGTRVGRVVMARISCCGESVIYTSDVQGPADPAALEVILGWCSESRPHLVILDAPPTYFAGFKVPRSHVEAGLKGMLDLIRGCRPEFLVVDHHLLRDLAFRDRISEHYKVAAENGVRLLTGAEYMGRPLKQLEARRRELWGRS